MTALAWIAPKPRRQRFTDWLVRFTAAGVFLAIGLDKFHARSEWVEIFARIGWGQWFRYVTGIVEALGGLLLVLPERPEVLPLVNPLRP